MKKHRATAEFLPALLLVLSLISTSCGFHPRGSVTGLTGLGSIFVDAEQDLSFTKSLKQALTDAAFDLAANRDAAETLLRVTQERQVERVVSVKSNGRVSELELTHSVDLLIAQAVDDSPPVYPLGKASNRVEVRREYTYDETGVLGKDNEARILREEMQTELVRQIVLRTIANLAPNVQGNASVIEF